MKPLRDLPVAGMGDGCGYEISRFWFNRLGPAAIERITKVMSEGCATHLQIIDDGFDLIVVFGAPIVYMDTAVRGSPIGVVLYAALFKDHGRDRRAKCQDVWNRLLRNTRGDLATAAMRLGVLNGVFIRQLVGLRDGAFVTLSFDSDAVQRTLRNPDIVLHELEECVKQVHRMKRGNNNQQRRPHEGTEPDPGASERHRSGRSPSPGHHASPKRRAAAAKTRVMAVFRGGVNPAYEHFITKRDDGVVCACAIGALGVQPGLRADGQEERDLTDRISSEARATRSRTRSARTTGDLVMGEVTALEEGFMGYPHGYHPSYFQHRSAGRRARSTTLASRSPKRGLRPGIIGGCWGTS